MASRKIKDVAVKVGEYDDRNTGQKKNRYENVGSVFKSDDGSTFMLLKRTFNPAGVPSDGRDQILLSFFDLRDQNGGQGGGGSQGGQSQGGGAAAGDDEILF